MKCPVKRQPNPRVNSNHVSYLCPQRSALAYETEHDDTWHWLTATHWGGGLMASAAGVFTLEKSKNVTFCDRFTVDKAEGKTATVRQTGKVEMVNRKVKVIGGGEGEIGNSLPASVLNWQCCNSESMRWLTMWVESAAVPAVRRDSELIKRR